MKHIITLIDGTSRMARKEKDSRFSNIYRLNLALKERRKNKKGTRFDDQVVFYYPGIGSGKRLDSILAKIRAYGIEDIIKDAYVNIASNYAKGDKIYLFGFSRGAVAARLIAGFISNFGLLKADCIDLLEYAWAYNCLEPKLDVSNFKNFVKDQGYEVRHDSFINDKVNISFLGVFDAVPGMSNPEKSVRKDFANGSLEPSPNVEVAVHILSIDEHRSMFAPLIWHKNSSKHRLGHQFIEQIWMPGVHTDIGGGYQDNLLANIALLTMIDKMKQYDIDLEFYEDYLGKIEEETKDRRKSFVINKNSILPNMISNLLYRRREIKRISNSVKKNYRKDKFGIYNSVHPIYFHFSGLKSNIKGVFRRYKNADIDTRGQNNVFVTEFFDDEKMNSLFK